MTSNHEYNNTHLNFAKSQISHINTLKNAKSRTCKNTLSYILNAIEKTIKIKSPLHPKKRFEPHTEEFLFKNKF